MEVVGTLMVGPQVLKNWWGLQVLNTQRKPRAPQFPVKKSPPLNKIKALVTKLDGQGPYGGGREPST